MPESVEEQLAEARETIARLNRRCQLAEAAVDAKVENFEKRSQKALRAFYFQRGVDFAIQWIAHGKDGSEKVRGMSTRECQVEVAPSVKCLMPEGHAGDHWAPFTNSANRE